LEEGETSTLPGLGPGISGCHAQDMDPGGVLAYTPLDGFGDPYFLGAVGWFALMDASISRLLIVARTDASVRFGRLGQAIRLEDKRPRWCLQRSGAERVCCAAWWLSSLGTWLHRSAGLAIVHGGAALHCCQVRRLLAECCRLAGFAACLDRQFSGQLRHAQAPHSGVGQDWKCSWPADRHYACA